jgi:hypothetical protein
MVIEKAPYPSTLFGVCHPRTHVLAFRDTEWHAAPDDAFKGMKADPPVAGSQLDSQGLVVGPHLGAPTHTPLTHLSFTVHRLPSSHRVPLPALTTVQLPETRREGAGCTSGSLSPSGRVHEVLSCTPWLRNSIEISSFVVVLDPFHGTSPHKCARFLCAINANRDTLVIVVHFDT